MPKQYPRRVQLSILGGRLTGVMEIPLDIDRFSLAVPPNVPIHDQFGHLDFHQDITGVDYLEFTSTNKFVLDDKDEPIEIFECIHYP